MSLVPSILSAFETRGKAVGLTIGAIAGAGGISRSTWNRWANEDVGPRLTTWTEFVARAERLVGDCERRRGLAGSEVAAGHFEVGHQTPAT